LYDDLEGAVAICVAHLAHLISVLVLFSLTLLIFPSYQVNFAFIAASLQIISPAGLFLSAPYAESSCACLSFAGILFFSKSLESRSQSAFSQNVFLLISGLLFGIATTFRSNAILNGVMLLEEAFRLLLGLLDGIDVSRILRLIVTGVAGLSVGAGFVLPQYIAYSEYCGIDVQARPWCSGTLPSIYTFVQDHYW
jgi:phosphatidylinositol glycan class V